MSEYELLSLVFDLFREMDAQIRFWMEATFAVVVAVFFAGPRLSRSMRRLIAVLYLAASGLAALRWILTLRRNVVYRERLIAGGYSEVPTDPWLLGPIVLLILVIFVAGVVGTMYFLRRPVGDGGVQGAPSD
jgi:hypothetical protein